MNEWLSILFSVTGDSRQEVLGSNPCQGQRDGRPIFIVVSDVPKDV